MPARALTEAETLFWQDTVDFLQSALSLPRASAKLLAYLMLQDEPVTLDEIAAGADMAKSAASVATKGFVQSGGVRRVSLPGTHQRGYVVASNSFELVVGSLTTF